MFSDQYETSSSVLDYLNTIVTLIGVVWGIWTAAWHLNFQHATKHLGSLCQDKDAMKFFVADIPSYWSRIFPFFMGRVQVPQVPSVSTILQAGDDGVFTSSMFGATPPNQMSVSWIPIYESFFLEYAWNLFGPRNWAELRPNNPDHPKYLLKYQRKAQEKVWTKIAVAAGEKKDGLSFKVRRLCHRYLGYYPSVDVARGILVDPNQIHEIDQHLLYYRWNIQYNNRGLRQQKLWKVFDQEHGISDGSQRNGSDTIGPILIKAHIPLQAPSLDIIGPPTETKSTSGSEITADPKQAQDIENTDEGQSWVQNRLGLWIYNGKPCVEVSEDELAGLAFAMGMVLKSEDSLPSGPSAFSALLTSASDGCMPTLRFAYGSRRYIELPVGSGYSTLFTKYMACGCLPFARQRIPIRFGGYSSLSGIFAVKVTKQVLAKIMEGRAISEREHGSAYIRQSVQYLNRLPSSAQPYIFDHFWDKGERGSIYRLRGNKLDSNYDQHKIVGSWIKAVAGIAFGGLVPMAPQSLIDAIGFTVGEEVGLGGAKKLQELINAVLNEAKDEKIVKDVSISLFDFGTEVVCEMMGQGEVYDFESILSNNQRVLEIVLVLSQYNTLLERLIAMSTLKGDIKKGKTEEEQKLEDVFTACYTDISKSYFAACDHRKRKSEEEDEEELDRIKTCLTENRLSTDDCGIVARYIIKAWVRVVKVVEWDEDDDDEDSAEGENGDARNYGESGAIEEEEKPPKKEVKETQENGEVGSETGARKQVKGDQKAKNEKKRSTNTYKPIPLAELPDLALWE